MIIFNETIYPLQIIEGLLNSIQIGGENRLGQTLSGGESFCVEPIDPIGVIFSQIL
jgi:hypothetical protein